MSSVVRTSLRSVVAGLLLLVGATPGIGAQSVLLTLHPRVGDTLHTRLEQRTEVSGSAIGSYASAMNFVTTDVSLDSRTIVRQSLTASTVVLTVVDSADITTSDAHAASRMAAAEQMLRGQQLLLRLASDGSIESARDARGGAAPAGLAQSMSAMPAVFPRQPVRVGDRWTREMPLPAGGPLGARGSGHVVATFRLDSLSHGGDVAYVAMQGDVRPDRTSEGVELSGSVTGTMKIDRARGWLTESRVSITLLSLVAPSIATGLAPMRFVTRVTQHLRTMDKR